MHNSLPASGTAIKMAVFRGLIVILLFIRLKIIHCCDNFHVSYAYFLQATRIFLVFDNNFLSPVKGDLHLAGKI